MKIEINKIILVCIGMMVLMINLNAQSIDKVKYQLDSLAKVKTHLENDLTSTQRLIEGKSKLLSDLQTLESDKSIHVTATKELIPLDIKSTANGKKAFVIKKGELFKVVNFDSDFYVVDYRNLTGYVYYIYLNGYSGLEEFKAYCIKRNADRKRAEDLVAKSDLNSKRQKDLTEKFGSQYVYAIMQGNIWKGMTDAMARESIGGPDKINRTTGSFGVHEQWVYKNRYLYFEDGILTSWQDEK